MSAAGDLPVPIIVNVPSELPMLNRRASRILLDILVRLTDVPVLDSETGDGPRDC